MGDKLNLNKDEINFFGLKLDPNEGGQLVRCGLHIQLKLKLGQKMN